MGQYGRAFDDRRCPAQPIGLAFEYFSLLYDADVGKYQVKNAIMTKAFPVKGLEIFDSKIQGNVIDCDLYRCTIDNSHVLDSNLYSGNILKKTKVINVARVPQHRGPASALIKKDANAPAREIRTADSLRGL